MVAHHLPLVHRLCRKFSHSGEPLEDLVQVGALGLIKAIEKYEPQRGTPFKSFAIPVIVGEIKNYFRDHGWAVRVPRKLQTQRAAVAHAVDGLSQRLGRSPTISEIAQATGLSEDQVYDTFEVEVYAKPLSLDAPCDGDGAVDTSTLMDYLGADDPQFDQMVDRLDLNSCLHALDERERTIIYLKFYSGLTQSEIAARLGISQMHVSRLQRCALGKLRLTLAG
jgi:RNA polymerase sigma-B factor